MRRSFKDKIAVWLYQGNAELIESSSRKSQDFFIVQCLFGSVIMNLLGGQFLSGYAIYLGASDESVGYISIISSISGSFVIFAGLFLERFKSRRKLVFTLNSISKPLLCSIILIPLIVPQKMQVLALLIILIVAYSLNSFMNIAINSWFVNVIPMRIRGQYFSIRQMYAIAVGAIVPMIAGRIMDNASNTYNGFAILCAWAFISIIGENYGFLNVDDVNIDSAGGDKLKIRDVFHIPVRNKEFILYTLKLVVFYFMLYLSAALTQAYMLKYLELSYTFISAMTVMSSLVQIVVYPRWGKIGDERGHEWVMKVSIWFYVAQMALWACVFKGNMYVLIPVIYLISAIGGSGFAVSSFSTRYDIIPNKGFTMYDGFYSAVIGLALVLAPKVGGWIREILADIQYIEKHIQFGELRILFAISAVGILILQLHSQINNVRMKVKNMERSVLNINFDKLNYLNCIYKIYYNIFQKERFK